jgi:hypothetical protein
MVLYMNALVASGPGEANSSVVAVRRRARDFLGAHIAACAADVLDDHSLSPFAPELVCQHTRQQISAAAGRVGDDHLHGAGGEVGPRWGRDSDEQGRDCRYRNPGCPHACLLCPYRLS